MLGEKLYLYLLTANFAVVTLQPTFRTINDVMILPRTTFNTYSSFNYMLMIGVVVWSGERISNERSCSPVSFS